MGLKSSSLARTKTSQNWILRGATNQDKTPPKAESISCGIEGSNLRRVSGWSLVSTAEISTPRRRERRQRHGQRHHIHSQLSKKSSPGESENSRFGYQIVDIEAFLAKASINNPGNIPVVLSSPCLLYQTRFGGYQEEIPLPLGMVVNAVFKNQNWLYVQTPHCEEGYVLYDACLPLGILPRPTTKSSPCWETHTDIFPEPIGNKTDFEKLWGGSKSECGNSRERYYSFRDAVSNCGESSVDRLYLKAAASAKTKGRCETLLVVNENYRRIGRNTLSVNKNDVVVLINRYRNNWFWVRNKQGEEGFIPCSVVGNGYF